MGMCEEMCLLGIDPRSGRAAFNRWHRDLILGAALVADLDREGLISIEGSGPRADVRPTGSRSAVWDPVMKFAVEKAPQHGPTVAAMLVTRLGDGTWRRQTRRLVETGVLSVARTWPTVRHTIEVPTRREAVVSRTRDVLAGQVEPDLHTRRLVALLDSAGKLHLAVGRDGLAAAVATVSAFDPDVVVDAYREASRATAYARAQPHGGGGS